MKTISRLLLVFTFTSFLLSSCTDKCSETRTFRRFTSVQLGIEQVRKGIGSEGPRALSMVGKIYAKDNFIFINEVKRGVHVFDNTDPKNPKAVSFIRIPGNGDIAIKGDVMYADNYMDVVAFDIKDPKAVKEVGRMPYAFKYGLVDGMSWSIDSARGIIFDTNAELITQKISTNCDDFSSAPVWGWRGGFESSLSDGRFSSGSVGAPGGNTGTGGSMARFTIYDEYLYTVSQTSLNLFNLKNPNQPTFQKNINLGWGIETIFPYKDKLFIGSTTGMFIFDNVNPADPKQMASFSHARACDPVVANDRFAYVTLRSNNNFCAGATNQLDVIDISNLYIPSLVKTYPMIGPYGLGLDGNTLFICEGKEGIKTLDATNAKDVQLQQHLKGINAIDVIPMQKTLLVIGRDGLYQYDYSNKRDLKLLSKIAVEM
jgi:hypothetical protein